MSEDEQDEKKPLIKEVSTHPPATDRKGFPIIPRTRHERPPVPEINPKLREALAQPLTLADCQYAVNALKGHIVEGFERVRQESPEQVVPASESVREMQAAIDILTEHMTKGYTVQYKPPTAQEEGEGEGFGGLGDLWHLFNEIDPELKGKITKTLGTLFDMLNDKLGAT